MDVPLDIYEVMNNDGKPKSKVVLTEGVTVGGNGMVCFGYVDGNENNTIFAIKIQPSRIDFDREYTTTKLLMDLAESPQKMMNRNLNTNHMHSVNHLFQRYTMILSGIVKMDKPKLDAIRGLFSGKTQQQNQRRFDNVIANKEGKNKEFLEDFDSNTYGIMVFEKIEGTFSKFTDDNSSKNMTTHVFFGYNWMNYVLANAYGLQLQDNHIGNLAFRESDKISLYRMKTSTMDDEVSSDSDVMSKIDEICFAFPPGMEFIRIDSADIAFLDEDRRKFWIQRSKPKRSDSDMRNPKKKKIDKSDLESMIQSRYRAISFQSLYSYRNDDNKKKRTQLRSLENLKNTNDVVLSELQEFEDLNRKRNDQITVQYLNPAHLEESTPATDTDEKNRLSTNWLKYKSIEDSPDIEGLVERFEKESRSTFTPDEGYVRFHLDKLPLEPSDLYKLMFTGCIELNIKDMAYYMGSAFTKYMVSKAVADQIELGVDGQFKMKSITYYDTLFPAKKEKIL